MSVSVVTIRPDKYERESIEFIIQAGLAHTMNGAVGIAVVMLRMTLESGKLRLLPRLCMVCGYPVGESAHEHSDSRPQPKEVSR